MGFGVINPEFKKTMENDTVICLDSLIQSYLGVFGVI
jgi:hypothetical protein